MHPWEDKRGPGREGLKSGPTHIHSHSPLGPEKTYWISRDYRKSLLKSPLLLNRERQWPLVANEPSALVGQSRILGL